MSSSPIPHGAVPLRRLVLLPVAAVGLALPAGASAAAPAISPKAVSVSSSGAAAVQMANPTRRVLVGSAKLMTGRRSLAAKSVRLPARSVKTVTLRLSDTVLATLRTRGTRPRVTVVATLGARGARRRTVRRTITLRLPTAVTPPPAPSTRWVARLGSAGAYDDFAFTVTDGRMQLTQAALLPVVCMESGGSFNRTSGSSEVFDAMGPWTIGQDGQTTKSAIAVNTLVGSSPRTITYNVTGTSQSAGGISGTLGMSFFHSRLDFSTYPARTVFVNCFGSQSFSAVPAP